MRVERSALAQHELVSQTAYGWLYVKLDGTCSFQSRLLCLPLGAPGPAYTALTVALLLHVWIIVYASAIIYTAIRLRREIYQNFADPLLRLLLQSNIVALMLMLLPMLLIWPVNLAISRASATAYICSQVINDTVPAEAFVLTAVAVMGLLVTRPFTPADGRPTPEPVQQGFAWTQQSRDRKRARHERMRSSLSSAPSVGASTLRDPSGEADAAASGVSDGSALPVFCMETALKALYWSSMLYNFADCDEHELQHLHPEVRLSASRGLVVDV